MCLKWLCELQWKELPNVLESFVWSSQMFSICITGCLIFNDPHISVCNTHAVDLCNTIDFSRANENSRPNCGDKLYFSKLVFAMRAARYELQWVKSYVGAYEWTGRIWSTWWVAQNAYAHRSEDYSTWTALWGRWEFSLCWQLNTFATRWARRSKCFCCSMNYDAKQTIQTYASLVMKFEHTCLSSADFNHERRFDHRRSVKTKNIFSTCFVLLSNNCVDIQCI